MITARSPGSTGVIWTGHGRMRRDQHGEWDPPLQFPQRHRPLFRNALELLAFGRPRLECLGWKVLVEGHLLHLEDPEGLPLAGSPGPPSASSRRSSPRDQASIRRTARLVGRSTLQWVDARGQLVEKRAILRDLTFGQRVAEEEAEHLAAYFVETDQWRRMFSGEIDVVYGPKGSGKSAIYSILLARADDLFDRGIIVEPAENPRGAPAFQDLVADPPASEREFISIWKLYLLSLLGRVVRDFDIRTDDARELLTALDSASLVTTKTPLRRVLTGALQQARKLISAESYEGGLKLDPGTGAPTGLTIKVTLREPTPEERAAGLRSVNDLFELADSALRDSGLSIWILLDRLDVAFSDSLELEKNALRALFKVYLDLLRYEAVCLKIFLRTDIWQQVTEEGFREASHITREMTISWEPQSLLNLIVRRLVQNENVRDSFVVAPERVLSNVEDQQHLFYRIFPPQVDPGRRKLTTVDWVLSRTRDGTSRTAPREVIHLLSSVRDVQLQRLEVGDADPPDENLFSRVAIKEALPEVSRVRLEKTLYAENAELAQYMKALEGEKTN